MRLTQAEKRGGGFEGCVKSFLVTAITKTILVAALGSWGKLELSRLNRIKRPIDDTGASCLEDSLIVK